MALLYRKVQHKKDGHDYIEITGYEGSVSALTVPGEIEGLPVEAIGNHAFSGREDLESVQLPDTLRTLYGFAFHDCRRLKKISLFDSIDDYYDGVCRQCDSLREVDLTMLRGWYETIRNFLADNDRTLRFVIRIPENDLISCLNFPEYVYDFNENTMARTIQFSIAGSGMFYRECVDRRSIDYRQYDRLFDKAVIDGDEISSQVAIDRLLYPVELADEFRLAYEDYVRANAGGIIRRLIRNYEDNPETPDVLKALLGYKSTLRPAEGLFDEKAIDEGIRLSTEMKLPVLSAVLMDSAGGAGKIDSGFSF